MSCLLRSNSRYTLRAQNTSAVEDADDGQRKPYGKRYPRVWTKDAHGGKYSISTGPGARGGYDALEEHPDGTALVIEPGYEKPPTGATTNFVGNHMTQGAIDLAQDALTAPDRDREQRLARLERARGATTREGPVLVRALPSATNDGEISPSVRTRKTAIERYVWVDEADRVVLTVRARDLGGAARMRARDGSRRRRQCVFAGNPSRPSEKNKKNRKKGWTRREQSSAALQLHVLSLRLHALGTPPVYADARPNGGRSRRAPQRTPAPWPALQKRIRCRLEAAARLAAAAGSRRVAARDHREANAGSRSVCRGVVRTRLALEARKQPRRKNQRRLVESTPLNDRSRDGASKSFGRRVGARRQVARVRARRVR